MLAREVFDFATKYFEAVKDPETECWRAQNIYFNKILDMAEEWKSGMWRNQFDEQLRTRSLDEVIQALRSGEIQLQDGQ